MSTEKFSDLPATSSCTLGSSPVMIICDRRAGWSSSSGKEQGQEASEHCPGGQSEKGKDAHTRSS